MTRYQKILLKRILSVFVPLIILIALAVVGTNVYVAYQMIHPPRRPVVNTPRGYEQLLQKPIWDEKSWPGARGQMIEGWLLYQDHPAPVIILTHGYAANREEMLGPSFALWSAGFNVVAYDLRGHGASTADQTSLGPVELADLKATIDWAKVLKDEAGNPLCDGRIGLYGADLGGFISLSAAADDPAVKAVAVDTIYPTQSDYLKYQTKRLLGSNSSPGESWAEGSVEQALISACLGFMRAGAGVEPHGVNDAMSLLGERSVLMIQGKQASMLYDLSVRAAELAPTAEIVVLDQSRAANSSLFKESAETYDATLAAFFSTAPGLEPPPPSRAAIDEQRKREAERRSKE